MCVIIEKKMQLNIARLCGHNILSFVVFWLGRGGAGPLGPPSLATPMIIIIFIYLPSDVISQEKTATNFL